MRKGRGNEAQRARPAEPASGHFRIGVRKRSASPADRQEAFERAFADALSDILEEELRLIA